MNTTSFSAGSRRARSGRFAAGSVWAITLLTTAFVLGGCRSGPQITDQPFTAAEARVDSSGDEHVLVVQLPSPGWSLALDQTRPGLGAEEALVTIREPDPRVAYPQVITTQRLNTTVRSGRPVRIYVRSIGHAGDEKRYRVLREPRLD